MKKLSALFVAAVFVFFGMTSAFAASKVTSQDKILTVTPKNNGLQIQTTFTQPWKHINICVRELEEGRWFSEVVADVQVVQKKGKSTCEVFYPFTKKGTAYKVWFIHMGNSNDEWADWTSEEANGVTVTADGGAGRLNASCIDVQYWSPRRGLFLNQLYIEAPESISIEKKFRVRAEKDHRWQGGEKYFETTNLDKTIWFPENKDDDFTSYLIGSKKLFITVELVARYNGVEYSQRFFGNWPTWDDSIKAEIEDSNWFIDYGVFDEKAPKLAQIRIDSLNNNRDNSFIASPVANHVKEQAKAWNAPYIYNPDPWNEKCKISVYDEKGTLVSNDDYVGKVKVRGNYTTTYNKKSFRITFDKKQKMLGLNKDNDFRSWVLLACFKDASMLRDGAALKMYKAMFPDYYASDCKLVEVYINDVYWGIYLLAEQQEVKKNRVNVKDPKKDYNGTDIGYFIEYDGYSQYEPDKTKFEIDYGTVRDYNGTIVQEIQKGYSIKSEIHSMDQTKFINDYMNKLWKICYEAAYNQKYYKFDKNYELTTYTPDGKTEDEKCKNCISKVIDVKSLADMYILCELVCDPDLYHSSFLLDIDFSETGDKLLRFEAPWDFDSAMGNKNFCVDDVSHDNITGKNEMFAGACQTDVNCFNPRVYGNPWMLVFIKCGWFQKLVKSEWAQAKSRNGLKAAVDFINASAKYTARLEFNRLRWDNPAITVSGELCDASKAASFESQAASAEYLRKWITNRYAAVDTIIGGLK